MAEPPRPQTKSEPFLRTAQIARAVGVHPNTVRMYEAWGFLPPVARGSNGYRLFTEDHLDQMRLARTALHGGWPGRRIRRSAFLLIKRSASGDVQGALRQARDHLATIKAERARAEAAAQRLEDWAKDVPADGAATAMPIRKAAELLDVSADVLRNWERNGLIEVPRDPRSSYRRYGPAEIGRLQVIQMLLRAGYSTMAVLRMLLHLDAGSAKDLRQVLDTPRADEDVYVAADRWLTELTAQEKRAADMIGQLEAIIRKRQRRRPQPGRRARPLQRTSKPRSASAKAHEQTSMKRA